MSRSAVMGCVLTSVLPRDPKKQKWKYKYILTNSLVTMETGVVESLSSSLLLWVLKWAGDVKRGLGVTESAPPLSRSALQPNSEENLCLYTNGLFSHFAESLRCFWGKGVTVQRGRFQCVLLLDRYYYKYLYWKSNPPPPQLFTTLLVSFHQQVQNHVDSQS